MLTRKRHYCAKADQPATPVRDWGEWISGTVDNFIRKNNLVYLKSGSSTGRLRSDFREELIQECWLRLAYAQQINPITQRPLFRGSNKPAYLKRVIMNHLINWKVKMKVQREFDATGRACGWKTEGIDDSHEQLESPDQSRKAEAAQDVQRLAILADLSDTQLLVIELIYGFGRGDGYGERSVKAVTSLLGQSIGWVRARQSAAIIKMRVVANTAKSIK